MNLMEIAQKLTAGELAGWAVVLLIILFSLIPVVLKVLLIHRKYAKESEERLPGKGARAVVLASLFAVFLFGILFLRHDLQIMRGRTAFMPFYSFKWL